MQATVESTDTDWQHSYSKQGRGPESSQDGTAKQGRGPRANKEEVQRAVKMALQNSHNGGVAGGGNSFFPSFELSAVLHRDLPCGNEMPNKMHLKNNNNFFYNVVLFSCFVCVLM